MKFFCDNDAKLFCIEIEQLDLLESANKNFEPSPEMLEIFVKKRREFVPKIKDFRRRQNMKRQWGRNRYKLMRGIKRFHKSTAGKRFHRALGRFLATRESFEDNNQEIPLTETASILKALTALKLSAFIELEYYHSMTEELEYRNFLEELLPAVERLEKNLLAGSFEISEDDENFFLQIVKPESVIYALEESLGKPFDELKTKWDAEVKNNFTVNNLDDMDDVNLAVVLHDLKSKF